MTIVTVLTACAWVWLLAWMVTGHLAYWRYDQRCRVADARFLFSADTPEEWRARRDMIDRVNRA